MAFQLLNAKQLFASLHWENIILVSALDHLEKHVRDKWGELSASDQNKWDEVFSLFSQMPSHEGWVYGSGTALRKMVVGVGSFVTKSPNNEEFPEDYTRWGWQACEKLLPHLKMISQWNDKHKLGITVPTEGVKKAVKWKQRLDAGEYQLKVFDPVAVLAEAESYAIYISDLHNKGFLDGRGLSGAPLAGARMFETAGSAYTTITSRGLANAVVVKVKSNLLGLDVKSVANQNCGDILSAVAIMEKKRLQEALEEASIEQLRNRLTLLEQQHNEHTEIQTSKVIEEEAPKRRRM